MTTATRTLADVQTDLRAAAVAGDALTFDRLSMEARRIRSADLPEGREYVATGLSPVADAARKANDLCNVYLAAEAADLDEPTMARVVEAMAAPRDLYGAVLIARSEMDRVAAVTRFEEAADVAARTINALTA